MRMNLNPSAAQRANLNIEEQLDRWFHHIIAASETEQHLDRVPELPVMWFSHKYKHTNILKHRTLTQPSRI